MQDQSIYLVIFYQKNYQKITFKIMINRSYKEIKINVAVNPIQPVNYRKEFYIILKLKFPGSLSRNKGEVWVNVLIDC